MPDLRIIRSRDVSCAYTLSSLHGTNIFQVFQVAYCTSADMEEVESRCKDLLEHVKALDPLLLQRPKFHLLLHLADNIREFGPTAGYTTERYNYLLD